MAGDWIKMRSNIKDDPDVVVMAGTLSVDEFSIVGRLHAVWAWLDQHSKTGTNVRITSAYLDRLTACPGFADAMRAVDWLRGRDGDLEFPNFDKHNGDSAKSRASETKRKQEQRDQKKCKDNPPASCPENAGTHVPKNTGPEKRREESIERDIHTPRRPTLAQAKSYAPNAGVTPDQAAEWWEAREASNWMRGSAGGGTTPVGSWQSDLKTYVGRSGGYQTSNHGSKTPIPALTVNEWEK